jgi:hypothetical protein
MGNSRGSVMWLELLTTDVAAARRFYGDVVGWKGEQIAPSGVPYTLLKAAGQQVAGLMALPTDVAANGKPPFWGLYVEVDDVDASAAHAVALGGRVLKTAQDIPSVGRSAVVTDPGGAALNLFRALASGSSATVSDAPGSVGWIELHSRDWAAAWPFYEALFGWRKVRATDLPGLGTYQVFALPRSGSGAMFNSPAAAGGDFWLVYLNVGDIDAAQRRVLAGGGRVLHGPQQVPGGQWIVQFQDPQGAACALLGPRIGGDTP